MRRLLDGSWLWAPLALTFALACDDGEATGGQASTGGGSAEGASGQGGQGAGQVSDGGGGQPAEASSSSTASGAGGTNAGRVHVVLFTHIEDATPGGALGTAQNEASYLNTRGQLIEMAELAQTYDLQWVLQPDWKILEAALLYEDAETMASTNDKNFLLYLRDDLGVVIDPHSHEGGGYNYTDVAHLLELLGVGGSTVIGGHIWDPSLPQFAEWDRFRDPVEGQMYPEASWRGDILIGAATPQHVNDPLVSGIWRPQDRDNYFVDDPAGNIVALGAWHDDAAGVQELVNLYADGTIAPEHMLTASWNISPIEISAGLADIEETVLMPIADLRDQGLVVVTDFTTLVETWTTEYGAEAFVYQP